MITKGKKEEALQSSSYTIAVGEVGTSPVITASPITTMVFGVTGLVNAYHGYKRNNSVLWAILWGLTGPVGTAIALAQGFGKPS